MTSLPTPAIQRKCGITLTLLLIKGVHRLSNIEKLQHDGRQYHQPFSISNVLNKYFRYIPFYLASKLSKSNRHFTSYLQQKKSSFCLETVNEVEFFLLLGNLDGKKSFGVDKLHPYLASIAAFEIFHPITYIINLSLKQCMIIS